MRCIFALFAFLVSGCNRAPDVAKDGNSALAVKVASIPSKYRGEWTNEQQYCGFDGDDLDSRLFVTENSVGFFESQHDVKTVTETSNGLKIEYLPNPDADLVAPQQLRLSPDGKRIFTSNDPQNKGYARCPAQGQQ